MKTEEDEKTVLACAKGVLQVELILHERLLTTASSYFVAMLNSGMKEAIDKKIEINDFSFEVVNATVVLLYISAVPQHFSFDQMKSILQFSDKYDIQLIKDLVQNYFIEKLSPANVRDLVNFVTTAVHAPKLHSKCSAYLIKCIKESKVDLDTIDKDVV
uniref:BTB domain-containing protein n=1 Tax=Panagrolaimus superbus TaxID=310955 RepID=A0A914Z8C9_9BILA